MIANNITTTTLAYTEVRAITEHDIRAFKEIYFEGLYSQLSFLSKKLLDKAIISDKYLKDLLSNPDMIFFGVYINKSTIGAVAGLAKKSKNTYYITNVYTKPEFRGKKIMASLLKYLIFYHRNHHNFESKLLIEVLPSNTSALNLYFKLSFIIVDFYYKDFSDDEPYGVFIMELAN
ncbi:MAG: GNAT family N-acetyltransferase [Neisseriaceae bacterium]